MAAAPPKIPAAQQRLARTLGEAVIYVSKERKAQICAIALEDSILEEELLLAMALCSISAPENFRQRQEELKRTHEERADRQRTGIAKANARKAAEAAKKSPPDETERDAPAILPPGPNSGPVGGGAAPATESARQNLTVPGSVAGPDDARGVPEDVIRRAAHPSAPAQVPVLKNANPEPTPVVPPQNLVAIVRDNGAAAAGNSRPAAMPAQRVADLVNGEKTHVSPGTHDGRPLAHGSAGSSMIIRPAPQHGINQKAFDHD